VSVEILNQQLVEELLGQRILIWGRGLEGRSSEQFLGQIGHRDYQVTEDNAQVLARFSEFDRILMSPGISLNQLSSANSDFAEIVATEDFLARLTSQTDLFLKYYRADTLGITGTKGKSTVATLLAQILADAGNPVELIGNIGRPAFTGLLEREQLGLRDSRPNDFGAKVTWVYELSSYQLEFTRYSPHWALTLNVAEDHLTHHGSLAEYRAAKARIAQFQAPGDWHFQLADVKTQLRNDPELVRLLRRAQGRLLGSHNLLNLAMVYVVVKNFGITDHQFSQSVAGFVPLPHRLELVGVKRGIAFYNDSIATNPLALAAGVQALSPKAPDFGGLSVSLVPGETGLWSSDEMFEPEFELQTLIFGGQNKGIQLIELTEFLGQTLQQQPDLQFIALPETGHEIARALGLSEKCCVPDLITAVDLAAQLTNPGRAVLFSPGAASFNQYRDFQARGQHFIDLVNTL
jgi:UDP-N-acetylmuramoylalanine--D-glutamate ligase